MISHPPIQSIRPLHDILAECRELHRIIREESQKAGWARDRLRRLRILLATLRYTRQLNQLNDAIEAHREKP